MKNSATGLSGLQTLERFSPSGIGPEFVTQPTDDKWFNELRVIVTEKSIRTRAGIGKINDLG